MPAASDGAGCVRAVQRMTALAVRLAKSLVADMRRALWWQERQARVQHRAVLAAQAAEQERQLAAARQRCFPGPLPSGALWHACLQDGICA